MAFSIMPNETEDEYGPRSSAAFDFDGVMIQEIIKVRKLPQEEAPNSFGIILGIVIENKEGKQAPFTINAQFAGNFQIVDSSIDNSKHEEFALINGCSILYSAIREQIMAISSRFMNGPFILPTVNFLDKRNLLNNKEEEKDSLKKTNKRKKNEQS